MGVVSNLVELAWSYSPESVAALRPWLLNPRHRARLSYQVSFLRPGRKFRAWWSRFPLPGNLGDLLTPIIISRLFTLVPIFCPKQSFLGVGSIVHRARAGTTVWGSGLISPDSPDHPEACYLAVRGPLTREVLIKRGRQVPAVYGDPGLLMPMVYRANVDIQYEIGLVPHYIHFPHVREVPSGVKLINVKAGTVAEIFDRIDQIARCEVVASSSLHGIILALAYGRKVVWLRNRANPLRGDTFKFEDFFASIGLSPTPLDWSPEDPVPPNLLNYAVSAEIPNHLCDGLIRVFQSISPSDSTKSGE